jgi:DNA gyrase subunit A
VGAVQVNALDEIMLISDKGTLVRTRVSEVSQVGRNTAGVILIRTIEGEKVVGVQRIDEIQDQDEVAAAEAAAAALAAQNPTEETVADGEEE